MEQYWIIARSVTYAQRMEKALAGAGIRTRIFRAPRELSDRGVWVSSGSACHKGRPSHVFAALGLPKPWLDGALRISFSPDSTRDEADRLVSALKGAADRLFTTLS